MQCKDSLEIEYLEISGQILASALYISKKLIQPNITTLEIDSNIEKFIKSCDAIPSFKNYQGHKYASCISVNSDVVHASPSKYKLKEGDLVTVDIGVAYNKNHTDAARTYEVVTKTALQQKLINVATTALNDGIYKAVLGKKVGDISYAIQRIVEMNGFRVPLEIGGHGIGLEPHTLPFIPNYGRKNTGDKLLKGMCLAIEPIILDGTKDIIFDKNDGRVFSKNGCLSAHMEDTVVVLETPLILTRKTLEGKFI